MEEIFEDLAEIRFKVEYFQEEEPEVFNEFQDDLIDYLRDFLWSVR